MDDALVLVGKRLDFCFLGLIAADLVWEGPLLQLLLSFLFGPLTEDAWVQLDFVAINDERV